MKPTFLLPFLALLPGLLRCQQSLAGPRFFPRGTWAAGIEDTRYDTGSRSYLFTLRDLNGKALVQYRLPLGHAHLRRGVLRIEETTTGVVPMEAGGLSYRTAEPPANGLGRLISAWELAFGTLHDPRHTGTLLSHALDPVTGTLKLRFRDEYLVSGKPLRTEKVYELKLFGRSLEVRAEADATLRKTARYNYGGFGFGMGTGLSTPARALHIPYMDMIPVFMGADGAFVTRFLDWYMSGGSTTTSARPGVNGPAFQGETGSGVYKNDKGEWNAPVREVAWITVSKRIEDTFPVIDRPPSPYRLLTSGRAVSQNGPGHSYKTSKAWVDRAFSLGLMDMVHIKWDWHKWPFNLNDPDYFPAAPAMPAGTSWGTAKEWLDFARACADSGWALCPYFSVDMMDPGYPDLTLILPPGSRVGSILLTPNPAYDASQCTRDAAGNLKKGWDTNLNLAKTNLAGKGHKTDVIGPHLFAKHLSAYALRIGGKNGWPAAGLHIDAQTGLPGWMHIDQRKGSAFSHSIAETLRDREAAFLAGKDGMQGPLMGEDGHWRYRTFASYAAGLLDGTSRKIPVNWSPPQSPSATNWDMPVIPDFELTEVVTRGTAFFGMGWEFHFKGSKYPVNDAWIDAWNTTLLSFGHAPYFSTNGDVTNNYWDWQGTLRSYHLVQGLSKAMRSSRIEEIRYEDGNGVERSLSEALVLNLDLRHPRLVLRFENGLEFKANHSATSWTTKVLGRSYTIPMDGFVGARANGLLALSALNPASGKRVDYAYEPGVVEVIDRRGVAQGYNCFPGKLLPIPTGLFNPPITELDLVVVRDPRRDRVIYARDFKTAIRALGPEPGLVGLEIEADDTTTLSLGRLRLGLRAVAKDSNGNRRDVTGRVQWSSSRPGVATVNRSGGLLARGGGRTTISAVLPGTQLQATQAVDATGLPILGALVTHALSADSALLSIRSDSHALLSGLLFQEQGKSLWRLVLGRPDPPGKHHRFVLTGLRGRTTYQVLPVVLNDFLLVGLGKARMIVTP